MAMKKKKASGQIFPEASFVLLFTRLCSARCFRACFARKSRVLRRETALFAVSVHREACYCSQHAAFWRGVNSSFFPSCCLMAQWPPMCLLPYLFYFRVSIPSRFAISRLHPRTLTASSPKIPSAFFCVLLSIMAFSSSSVRPDAFAISPTCTRAPWTEI